MSNFAGLSDYSLWLDWIYYFWQEYDLHDTTSQPRTCARLFPSLWVTCMRRAPAQNLGFHFVSIRRESVGSCDCLISWHLSPKINDCHACFFCFIYYNFSAKKKNCWLERSKLSIIPDLCSQTFIYCLLINYYMYSFLLLDLPRFVRLYLSDAISQW